MKLSLSAFLFLFSLLLLGCGRPSSTEDKDSNEGLNLRANGDCSAPLVEKYNNLTTLTEEYRMVHPYPEGAASVISRSKILLNSCNEIKSFIDNSQTCGVLNGSVNFGKFKSSCSNAEETVNTKACDPAMLVKYESIEKQSINLRSLTLIDLTGSLKGEILKRAVILSEECQSYQQAGYNDITCIGKKSNSPIKYPVFIYGNTGSLCEIAEEILNP